MERVLALEPFKPLLVFRNPELLRDDRRHRRVGLRTAVRGCRRRLVSVVVALQQNRYGEHADDQGERGQQEVPVAHVAIKVAEELRRLHVFHGVALAAVSVDVDVEVEVVPDVDDEASVDVVEDGPLGVAPPVRPSSTGVT